MKTAIKANRAGVGTAYAATLVVAAMGFAGAAQARDNVTFSVGLGVPGVQLGVSNAYPVYTQPQRVYVQPAPVYVQPQQVYVQPAPVYYQPPPPVYYPQQIIYGAPSQVYYGRPFDHRRHGGHYVQGPREDYGRGFNRGYGSVEYRR